jgi:hypothetical protein
LKEEKGDVKMHYIYKLVKNYEAVPWYELAEIYEDGVSYYFFRQTPVCTDGSQETFKEELARRGWKSGIVNSVYREKVKGQEFIDCLSFGAAFKKVFEQETGGADNVCVNLTTKEFLDRVEAETKKDGNGIPSAMLETYNPDSIRAGLEKHLGFKLVA